jgi:hypothetical protein
MSVGVDIPHKIKIGSMSTKSGWRDFAGWESAYSSDSRDLLTSRRWPCGHKARWFFTVLSEEWCRAMTAEFERQTGIKVQ